MSINEKQVWDNQTIVGNARDAGKCSPVGRMQETDRNVTIIRNNYSEIKFSSKVPNMKESCYSAQLIFLLKV